MNRLKYMDVPTRHIEGCIAKEVSVDHVKVMRGVGYGISIDAGDNKSFLVFQDQTCCEFVKVKLPSNIENLHNRKIESVQIDQIFGEFDAFEYHPLAYLEIMDSTGEEYTITYTAKSAGCMYSANIRVQKKWIACVFN